MARIHQPGWLAGAGLAAFSFLGAWSTDHEGAAVVLVLIALTCALAYLATRRLVLAVASGGSMIEASVDPRDRASQTTRDFLDAVDHAASIASGSANRVVPPELLGGPMESA